MRPGEFVGRVLISLACFIALGAIVACPPRPPAPIGPPDATDAAPTPLLVSCATACAHAGIVCSGSAVTCDMLCPRIQDPAYAPCVAAAKDCAGLSACDPGASP